MVGVPLIDDDGVGDVPHHDALELHLTGEAATATLETT